MKSLSVTVQMKASEQYLCGAVYYALHGGSKFYIWG